MKSKTPINYVRTLRRRWALTQEELASLAGIESRSSVSRIEQGERLPSLEAALALEVLFGSAPKSIFPHCYAEVEEAVMRKASVLHEGLIHSTNPAEKRKSALLEGALSRATASHEAARV
jgi:DNA-binding XRE family transcriptional regulator